MEVLPSTQLILVDEGRVEWGVSKEPVVSQRSVCLSFICTGDFVKYAIVLIWILPKYVSVL